MEELEPGLGPEGKARVSGVGGGRTPPRQRGRGGSRVGTNGTAGAWEAA